MNVVDLKSISKTEKCHIALFIPTLDGGGAERVVINLANALADLGHRVDVVLARKQGTFLDSLALNVNVVDLHVRFKPLAILALAYYLRTNRPTILISHMDIVNLSALVARQIARSPVKIIVCCHSNLTQRIKVWRRWKDLFLRQLLPPFYRKADAVIAVSSGVAEDIKAITGLSDDKVRVIYNPIISPELLSQGLEVVTHPWVKDSSVPLLVAAGRLYKQKDYPTMFRALRRILSVRPVRLIVLGDGPEKFELEQLVITLGVEGSVYFAGFVKNPAAYFSKASVFVLSSVSEGFGNVLVEALAFGTPVVSTDCKSGPAEILDGGRYGRLVEVGNDEAFAQAVLETLNQPPDGELLEKRALDFDAIVVASQYLDVLGCENNT